MTDKTLLVVEDEKKFRDIIALFLRTDGFNVLEAETGEKALEIFETNHIDLVILDVMLPGMNGFEVCKALRGHSEVPIIFLTAMLDDDYFMMGYRAGADDYVTKPFKASILAMKVKRMLERQGGQGTAQVAWKGLQIDEGSFLCKVDGEDAGLTQKEFQLCRMLMRNEGRVLTRDSLLSNVWGANYYGDTRVVDNHIKNLRRKIGPYSEFIKTVISVGYKFEITP